MVISFVDGDIPHYHDPIEYDKFYEYVQDIKQYAVIPCREALMEKAYSIFLNDISKYSEYNKLLNLCKKKEYTYYQFSKRKWTVNNWHGMLWKETAFNIGAVDKLYDIDSKQLVTLSDILKKKGLYIKKDELDDDIVVITNTPPESDLVIENSATVVRDEQQYRVNNNISDDEKRARKLENLSKETNYGVYIPSWITKWTDRNPDWYDTMLNINTYVIDYCSVKFYLNYFFKVNILPLYTNVFIKDRKQFNYLMEIIDSKKSIKIERLVNYVFSYSIYLLSKEEQLFGKKISMRSRSIFKDTEFIHLKNINEISRGMYSTFIPNLFVNNYKSNDIPSYLYNYLHGERYFHDRKETQRRINIISKQGLKDIDLSRVNAVFTGSALVACIAYNPLEENCSSFEDYVDTYYPDSDIDIAIFASNNRHYERSVNQLFNAIKNNIPTVTQEKIEQKYEKHKYYFKVNGITYDVFPIYKKTPAQLVSSFHMPVVRAWWDGHNTYALTSCVCAVLSGVNINYKWFFCKNTPIDIYLKYMKRGYTLLLNDREHSAVKKYIEEKKIDIDYRRGSISRFHSLFNKNKKTINNDPIIIDCPGIVNRVYGKVLKPDLSELKNVLDSIPDKISWIKCKD